MKKNMVKQTSLVTVFICILLMITSLSSTVASFSNRLNRLEKNIFSTGYENDEQRCEIQNQITYDSTSEMLLCTITFPEPTLERVGLYGELFTKVTIPGFMSIGDVGKPSLPVSSHRILLPLKTDVDEINVEVEIKQIDVEQKGFNLIEKPIIPAQPPIPIGSSPSNELVMDKEIYSSDSLVHSELYSNEGVHYCRGYGILDISTYPVNYNPMTGELFLTKKMMVEIKLKPSPMNQFFRSDNLDDKKWVESLVDNPKMTELYKTFNLPRNGYPVGLCDPSDNNGRGYDYVIIVRESLVNFPRNPPVINYNWSDFIARKQQQGLEITRVTVEDILACPQYWNSDSLFNDTPAIIREFCRDAYQDWGTQYLLIAGDDDNVHLDTMIQRRIMDSAELVVTDIYWTHLDKTFNEDRDNYWGEPHDTGFDLYSEMYSGSLPCDEPLDVSNWLTKNFYYEDSTDRNYLDNAAFYGGETGWDPEGDGIIDYSAIKGSNDWFGSDPHNAGPYPSWLGFQYGFETWNSVRPTAAFDLSVKWSATDPNPGWQGGTTPVAIEGLRTAINNNQCTLISGIAHANPMYSLDVYYEDWENQYHNTKPFLITDQGCHCGDMVGADDGVLHSMLFHSATELAFACIYNTGYGWGAWSSTNASSSLMMKSFWDYFFDTLNNSGSTLNWQLGKAQEWARDLMASTISWGEGTECFRETIQCNLLFGDPAQKIKPPSLPEHNIGVLPLTVDDHVKTNVTVPVIATIFNDGQNDETNIFVRFSINDVIVNSTIVPLLKNQTTKEMTFTFIPHSVGAHRIDVSVSLQASIVEGLYEDNSKNTTVLAGVLNNNTGELFDTIQQAINDPETLDGDLIIVPAGLYHEHIVVSKAISLVGAGTDTSVIDGGTYGNVILILSDDVLISGFSIQNGTHGIHVRSADSVKIIHNEIRKNQIGIYVGYSSTNTEISYNIIHNNTITTTTAQPHVSTTKTGDLPTYDYNSLQKNQEGGVFLEKSNTTMIHHNDISKNQISLIIVSADNNMIFNNALTKNFIGLSIQNGNNNIIKENNISNNKKGMIIYIHSAGNLIYNNNFNNSLNAVDDGEENHWDNGYLFAGNWWANYTGSDEFHGPQQNISGCDGIGDIPYNIPGRAVSRDQYPLMEPYTGVLYKVMNLQTHKRFETIQQALDDPETLDGHTIFIRSEIYREHLVMNKAVTLLGEDNMSTILEGNGYGTGITVIASGVTISTLTIQNCATAIEITSDANTLTYNHIINNDVSVELRDSSYNIISDNTFRDNPEGPNLLFSSFNSVSRNIFENNRYGMLIGFGSDNTITNNIFGNNFMLGIFIYESANLSVMNNTFQSGGIFIDTEDGSYSYYDSLLIENNTINGKYIRYYNNANQIVVPEDTGQLLVHNCSNFIIQHLTVSDTVIGIFFDCSSHNTIADNKIETSYHAGIWLRDSHHNTLSNNVIDNCNRETGFGLFVMGSTFNTILGNTITNLSHSALYWWNSDNNTVIENNITDTRDGVRIYDSNNNLFYHNNFMRNNNHIAYVEGTNFWDYGYSAGGNYWDDFDEPSEGAYDDFWGEFQNESGSDGIVDLGLPYGGLNPYVFDYCDGQDNYPLIEPYILGEE